MSSGLQNKMFNYEVPPPPAVWEKITDALDESELAHDFPAKLYGHEVAPPLTAWANIQASLQEEQPSLPQRRKIIPILRYAAAAVVIGLLAWGGAKLLNNKPGTGEVAKQEQAEPDKKTTVAVSKNDDPAKADSALAKLDEARNDAALEASKETFAKLDMAAGSRMKKAAGNFFNSPVVNNPEEELYRQLHYSGAVESAAHDYEINANNLTDRYITLMTPDGNIIRMSKKLSNLVCCVSGEEQDEDCKDQMKDWRKKIACSSIASSPDSFIDILNLVSSLQENH